VTTTTSNAGADVHGPVDFVLLEFPSSQLTGEAAPALLDLHDQGVIRLLDLLVISKSEDGSVAALEVSDPGGPGARFFLLEGARSGLLGDDDMREAAEAMRPGTVAALILYENTWAIPFVGAVLDSGGELIASARLPATDVMSALDAIEADN
jgi:uncharacterized membrane protein